MNARCLMLRAARRAFSLRPARGKLVRFRASPDAEQSFLVVVARDVSTREFLRDRLAEVFQRIIIATIILGIIVGLLFFPFAPRPR